MRKDTRDWASTTSPNRFIDIYIILCIIICIKERRFFDVGRYRKIDNRYEVAKGADSEAQRGLRNR
jgi:hypothetical protein